MEKEKENRKLSLNIFLQSSLKSFSQIVSWETLVSLGVFQNRGGKSKCSGNNMKWNQEDASFAASPVTAFNRLKCIMNL